MISSIFGTIIRPENDGTKHFGFVFIKPKTNNYFEFNQFWNGTENPRLVVNRNGKFCFCFFIMKQLESKLKLHLYETFKLNFSWTKEFWSVFFFIIIFKG